MQFQEQIIVWTNVWCRGVEGIKSFIHHKFKSWQYHSHLWPRVQESKIGCALCLWDGVIFSHQLKQHQPIVGFCELVYAEKGSSLACDHIGGIFLQKNLSK